MNQEILTTVRDTSASRKVWPMAIQHGAALNTGRSSVDSPRPNDGLADRVRQAYERKLREPVETIAAISALMKQRATANEEHAENVAAIEDAALRTDRMLGDLVEFVRSAIGGGVQ